MGLNFYNFKEHESLLQDELIQQAIDKLEERYQKMANWIKENKDIDECPECNSNDIEYKHYGIKCNNCDHKKEIKVPYPGKGGVVASRKLYGVIKEMFAVRMARERKKQKPSKKQMRNLPYELGKFDAGEYTASENKFLEDRYNELVNQDEEGVIGADNFLYHIMAEQELVLQKLFRKQALGRGKSKRNGLDKKREFAVYDDIIDNLEISRKNRKVDEEETVLDEVLEQMQDIDRDVVDLIKEYDEKRKEEEKKLKESKERRNQMGNKY